MPWFWVASALYMLLWAFDRRRWTDHRSIDLMEWPGFLSPEECDEWMQWIQRHPERFTTSEVEKTWGQKVQPSHRKSVQCWLNPFESSLIARLHTKIGSVVRGYLETSAFAQEKYQCVRYAPGGFFKGHYDEIKTLWGTSLGRDATFLIYLNDDFTGGETVFPRLNRTIRPEKGKAILFRNIHPDHRRILWYSFHEGRPVKHGEKCILNAWIHKKMI